MAPRALPESTPRKLPRWRGFNLLNKFGLEWSNSSFEEKDFEWIAELGFNFVRLPLDYRIWTETDNPYRLKEAELREIDRAVQFGDKYGIHGMLNFHRAPAPWSPHSTRAACSWRRCPCVSSSLSSEAWVAYEADSRRRRVSPPRVGRILVCRSLKHNRV